MSIVTVETARKRLGLAATADHRDEEIQALLDAAEGHVEDLSGHILERRAIAVPVIAAGGLAEIFAWPIVSVDALAYRDGNGVDQVGNVADLRIQDAFRPARIAIGEGSWPADYHSNGVATVTAGYANVEDVPAKLVQAVLVLVGQWFEDPTGERPISPHVKALCFGFRSAL